MIFASQKHHGLSASDLSRNQSDRFRGRIASGEARQHRGTNDRKSTFRILESHRNNTFPLATKAEFIPWKPGVRGSIMILGLSVQGAKFIRDDILPKDPQPRLDYKWQYFPEEVLHSAPGNSILSSPVLHSDLILMSLT